MGSNENKSNLLAGVYQFMFGLLLNSSLGTAAKYTARAALTIAVSIVAGIIVGVILGWKVGLVVAGAIALLALYFAFMAFRSLFGEGTTQRNGRFDSTGFPRIQDDEFGDFPGFGSDDVFGTRRRHPGEGTTSSDGSSNTV